MAGRRRATISSPDDLIEVDHDARWRPRDRRGPVCRYTFRGLTCSRRGAHYCQLRADRFLAFCSELLVHTKGALVRTAFILEDWQEHEIARPLFGEVVWSAEHGRYVRRYRIAYLVMARKNGKSELAAAIQLYMLVGDDEESAEVYCAAANTRQAGKVFEPAQRMTQLSPVLSKRLRHIKNARRLIDEKSNSYYGVITADADNELGHNPHGFNLDEVLSQPDDSLWTSMVTAVGARTQELCFATTTETNDDSSFGATLIDEAERVQEDPTRAPHIFAFVRKMPRTDDEVERLRRLFPGHPHLPVSIDWTDERNWKWPNPALGKFKSLDSMRRQALEAIENPAKENGFRQFHLNQRVQAAVRFIPLDLWDENIGPAGIAPEPDWLLEPLLGQRCWGGLDLSSKLDMTAWCLLFPGGEVRWRFWIPESMVPILSSGTGGDFEEWVARGWVTPTEGDTIDYERIYADIAQDAERFAIERVLYDRWSGEPVRQRIEADTGVELVESGTTYAQMTGPMVELMRALKANELRHGANPVARWMAENLNAKRPRDDPDRIRPVKPDRAKSAVRIDGMPALLFALDAKSLNVAPAFRSAYEDDDARVEVV